VIVLRLLAVLTLLAVALSFGFFLYTRNRRYLAWARRTLQFAFVVVIVTMIFYVLERAILL
jgi:hypothetical protein